VLKVANRFVSISEIAQLIKRYEPNANEALIKTSFGKHTAKYKAKELIHTYSVGSFRNTVYGLPEWIDQEGKALPEYKHSSTAFGNTWRGNWTDLFAGSNLTEPNTSFLNEPNTSVLANPNSGNSVYNIDMGLKK
jgi:hypothetical protein